MAELALARDEARSRIWPVVVHSMRTAAATGASLLVARLFGLPETYWAPITTIVITQSSLGAAFAVSSRRFFGTAIGAALGDCSDLFRAYATGICREPVRSGVGCAAAHLERSAYRFAGSG